MNILNKENISNILKNVKDLNSNNNIVETGTLNNIIITKELVSIILIIKHEKNLYNSLVKQCEEGLDVNTLLSGPICHAGFKRLN